MPKMVLYNFEFKKTNLSISKQLNHKFTVNYSQRYINYTYLFDANV